MTTISINIAEKDIVIRGDDFNMTTAYNKKKRGFKEVVKFIEENRESLKELSIYSVISKLDSIKDLSFRSYCALD